MSDPRVPPSGRSRRGIQPIADILGGVMDPILRRKSGMTTGLIGAWSEIAGARLQDATRPERLVWPAQRSDDDPFEPATLIVACEAATALRLQHQTSELIGRINAFFGFAAVDRIKIVQKPVNQGRIDRRPTLRNLVPHEQERVAEMVSRIEDPKLRKALQEFAEATLRRSKP
jgi:hypothetical protein